QALPAEDELAEPDEPDRRALLDRVAPAVEKADASALAQLLAEGVALGMPPGPTRFPGPQGPAGFTASRLFTEPGGLRLVPVMANGQPAFAVYRRGSGGAYLPHAIQVLTITALGVARIVAFTDPGLFTLFGLPQQYGTTAGPTTTPAPGSGSA